MLTDTNHVRLDNGVQVIANTSTDGRSGSIVVWDPATSEVIVSVYDEMFGEWVRNEDRSGRVDEHLHR